MFANNSTANQRTGALATPRHTCHTGVRAGTSCGSTACSPQLNEQKCIFVSFYLPTASTGKQTHSVAPSVIAKHMPSFGLPCALDKSIMLSVFLLHTPPRLLLLPLRLLLLLLLAAGWGIIVRANMKCRRSNDCCHLSCGNTIIFALEKCA